VYEIIAHILPPYVLACAISNYIMLNLYNRQCRYFHKCDTEFYIEDPCCSKFVTNCLVTKVNFLMSIDLAMSVKT